ncbi:hypothetical protein ACKWTF_014818 [Chironomus riparius]
MKLILIKFLIIAFMASKSSCSTDSSPKLPEKQTLNQIYEELQQNSPQSAIIQEVLKFTIVQNFDCIKEKLKLPQIGQQELPILEAQFLSAKALTACSSQDETELLKNILNKFSKNHQIQMTDEDKMCTKMTLQTLDATSKFVENFNKNSMTDIEKEACDERVKVDKSGLDEELGKISNEDFTTFTCGRLNKDVIYKFMCTFGLVIDEVDDELRNTEMDKLVGDVLMKIDEVFDCRIGKLLS